MPAPTDRVPDHDHLTDHGQPATPGERLRAAAEIVARGVLRLRACAGAQHLDRSVDGLEHARSAGPHGVAAG